MRIQAGDRRRLGVVAAPTFVITLLVLLTAAVASGHGVRAMVAVLVLAIPLAIAHERLLSWRSLLALVIVTILFVPIKRYTLPASLPFNLELYRVVVALLIGAWLMSLLIDPRVRVRRSGFEAPLAFLLIAILLSLTSNIRRVSTVGADVVKSMTFFGSFILVFYAIVSLPKRPSDIDFLVRVLAGGGAVLGLLAIVESATNLNVFNHLHSVLPFLQYDPSQAPELARGGRIRAYGSAQHPIALGAALAMLLPLAVYRAVAFRQRRWWLAALLILMGSLTTRSRTGFLMLLAIGIVYILLRPQQMKRFWPAIIPTLIIIHFALPGTLGTIKESFFPQGGIVAQQKNANVGSGRLATLGPALHSEFTPNPILGEGFGTRVTTPDPVLAQPNGPILDDEWLGVLLEIGVVGTLALVWLFVRSLRRMGKAAKNDFSPRGWLLAATTAGVAGYGLGMFTYDAFSFIQVTFLLFIVLGIGAAALLWPSEQWERLVPSSG